MESFPKCDVCNQQLTLKGPEPYLLPCLHSVCETCINSIYGGTVSCSPCQREVNLTETHLQKDVVRQKEIFHLTVQHRPSELLCTHEDDGNQAVCWCQECEEFLCEYCQNLHNSFKATKRHVIQNVASIQPGTVDHDEYCPLHKNCPLDYWDSECNIPICGRCRKSEHDQHDVEDIGVAAGRARTEIESHKKHVQEVDKKYSTYITKAKQSTRFMDETSNALSDKISHTFSSLKSMLNEKDKELRTDLQQHADQVKSNLHSQMETFQLGVVGCKMTLEYIRKTLLYSSKYDLLTVKQAIRKAKEINDSAVPPNEQEDRPQYRTGGLDKIQSTLSAFGDIPALRKVISQIQTCVEMATQTEDEHWTEEEMTKSQHEMQLKEMETNLLASQSKVEKWQTVVTELMKETEKLEQEASAFKKSQNEIRKLEASVQDLAAEKNEMKYQAAALASFLEMQGIYFLKPDAIDKSSFLTCVHLKFDTQKVNLTSVHINDRGMLINKCDPRTNKNTSGRFQNYKGTTSNTPITQTDSSKYFEIHTDVQLDKSLEERNLVLEMGICRERDRDEKHCIPAQQYCYSLEIAQCPQHKCVCVRLWKDGKVIHHLSDILLNTAGSCTTLHYGALYNTEQQKIAYFDLKRMIVIGTTYNVDYTQPMWPMFGLYADDKARMSMELVVGNDIVMTPEKKILILTAL